MVVGSVVDGNEIGLVFELWIRGKWNLGRGFGNADAGRRHRRQRRVERQCRRGDGVRQERRTGKQILRPGGKVGVLGDRGANQKEQNARQSEDAHGTSVSALNELWRKTKEISSSNHADSGSSQGFQGRPQPK